MEEKTRRGFATMDPAKRLENNRKGGANVPAEKRAFFTQRDLARSAGAKGGKSVSAEKRSFAVNRELAREAGKKGGKKTAERKKAQAPEAPEAPASEASV